MFVFGWGELDYGCASALGAFAEIFCRILVSYPLPYLFEAFVERAKQAFVSGGSNLALVVGHVRTVSASHRGGNQ